MTGQTAVTKEPPRQAIGKYLAFMLGNEYYGLEILKVREITGMMDVAFVPRMPPFVRGVVNLRGRIIPVVDLRLKLGMPEAARTPNTCIIMVDTGGAEIGIIVDKVLEVANLPADHVQETPSFGIAVDTSFLVGIANAGDRVILLLDVDKVVVPEEIDLLGHNVLQGETACSDE